MSNEESGQRRTILVITYAFPPVAYVGVHRTLKYCRYLPAHRWRPVVLTCRPARGSFTDESLCRQLPADLEVHRTADFDPARLMEWQSRLRRRSASSTDPGERQATGAPPPATLGELLADLKRFIKALLTQSPDSHIFWLLFALPRGLWILLTRKIDLLYSTSPPHSSHIATYLLAKLSRKPYVLDFRDPWVSAEPASMEGRIKRAIVRDAETVICVSQGECEELRAEFPDLRAEHFTYITNGYDPSDVPGAGPSPARSPHLTLTHAGTIYPGIAAEFFDALEQLVAQDPDATRSMRVQLLGEIAPEYSSTVARLEAVGIAKAHGFQPHGATLRMMHASDVLLILLGGCRFPPSEIPSKVFEYLHAGKPILAVAPEGDLARVVRQSGLGIVVPPQSVDAVAGALRALLADHAAGRLARSPNHPYIRSFERAALTKKLASVLDGVMEASLARQ